MKRHITIITLLVAALALAACGPDDENNDTDNNTSGASNDNSNDNSNDTGGEPAQATVEDGPGGDTDCPRGTASPEDVPDSADILTVNVDYDGTQAIMTITFAGDAQSVAESSNGTEYSGNFKAEIGTLYPFSVSNASGEWQNGAGSLATEFSAEWTSSSQAVITVGGFEAASGSIVTGEAFTQAPVDTWCDRVTVEL